MRIKHRNPRTPCSTQTAFYMYYNKKHPRTYIQGKRSDQMLQTNPSSKKQESPKPICRKPKFPWKTDQTIFISIWSKPAQKHKNTHSNQYILTKPQKSNYHLHRSRHRPKKKDIKICAVYLNEQRIFQSTKQNDKTRIVGFVNG